MGTIELICTVITAVAAVLGGIWFILSKIFKIRKVFQRIDNMEENISDIKKSIENLPCTSHHEIRDKFLNEVGLK